MPYRTANWHRNRHRRFAESDSVAARVSKWDDSRLRIELNNLDMRHLPDYSIRRVKRRAVIAEALRRGLITEAPRLEP